MPLGQEHNPDNQQVYAVELATGRRLTDHALELMKPDQLSHVDLPRDVTLAELRQSIVMAAGGVPLGRGSPGLQQSPGGLRGRNVPPPPPDTADILDSRESVILNVDTPKTLPEKRKQRGRDLIQELQYPLRVACPTTMML